MEISSVAESLVQDILHALRHFRRSPGFAIAAIITLALGIGANTAIFTMLNAIVLKRLPIVRPDELLAIAPINSRGLPRTVPMSAVAELHDGPLEHLCAYLGSVVFPVLANDTPVETSTTFVTGECFNAFGITPIMGRAITEEDAPIHGAGAHIAVISHRLWTQTYHGDPSVIGRPMLVNNVPVTIVGVLPKGFKGLEIDNGIDIFTPFDAVLPAGRGRRQLASYLLGRLRPGTSAKAAAAEIDTRWPALLEAVLPAGMAPTERTQLLDSKPRLISMGVGTSRVRERYVQPLLLILGLTSLLLILACVNLGGLLLARLNARSSEIAVRLALGGTRWRLARQMLAESLLLSLAGAVVAMPIAYFTAVTLASYLPPVNVPYTLSFAPDWRVFAVTTTVAIVMALLMSALPVWFATTRQIALQSQSDRTVAGSTGVWGRILLVAQVALALVMLINATLLTRSLYLLHHGDLGIRTNNIVTVKLRGLPNGSYDRGGRDAYYPPLVDKIRALPGVTSVALSSVSPRASGPSPGSPVAWKGDDYGSVTTGLDSVSPDYFATLGLRLVAGRNVSWQDNLTTEKVGVVSESLARALATDGNVIGRVVRIRTMPVDLEYTVVGVVADGSTGDPRDTRPRMIYRPLLQVGANSALNPNLLVHTTDPTTAASGIRAILHEGGRDYAQEVISLDDLLARAPATERMSAMVAGAMGGIAVLLALIGVHGALAYAVTRRRKEIGVRLAIGATPRIAAQAVLREGFMVCALGVAIGVPLAAVTARSLRSLLFGISESDPATFVATALAFLILGLIAGLIPARRAACVDPVIALRAE